MTVLVLVVKVEECTRIQRIVRNWGLDKYIFHAMSKTITIRDVWFHCIEKTASAVFFFEVKLKCPQLICESSLFRSEHARERNSLLQTTSPQGKIDCRRLTEANFKRHPVVLR